MSTAGVDLLLGSGSFTMTNLAPNSIAYNGNKASTLTLVSTATTTVASGNILFMNGAVNAGLSITGGSITSGNSEHDLILMVLTRK